jgi:N-terminal helicase PWI domain
MAEEVLELENRILKVLALDNPRDSEKKLFAILGVEKFEVIRLLVKNKSAIYWGTLF